VVPKNKLMFFCFVFAGSKYTTYMVFLIFISKKTQQKKIMTIENGNYALNDAYSNGFRYSYFARVFDVHVA